jgi:hypothetical protein
MVLLEQRLRKLCVETSNPSFLSSTSGADPWPRDRYLKIWTCQMKDSEGSGLLGYAHIPSLPDNENISTDGVVIKGDAFGRGGSGKAPFDLGRTAVHEVAHWLNVFHI